MNDKLLVTLGEEERELFMSYALLNRLTRLVGNHSSDISTIFVEPSVQHEILTEVLAPRKKGKRDPNFDLDEVPLETEAADEIIGWVGGHVMDFFMRGLERTAALGLANAERAKSLTSSLPGTEASTSSNPSAGPSTQSPAV